MTRSGRRSVSRFTFVFVDTRLYLGLKGPVRTESTNKRCGMIRSGSLVEVSSGWYLKKFRSLTGKTEISRVVFLVRTLIIWSVVVTPSVGCPEDLTGEGFLRYQ